MGARGIITNKVRQLIEWTKSNKIRLATPADDSLKPATSRKVIYPDCDCNHRRKSGCVIVKPAPSHSACRCKTYGLSCTGSVVLCKDPQECTHPGRSVQDCVQGGGNCDGYDEHCDCDYHPGGCRISLKAPVKTGKFIFTMPI